MRHHNTHTPLALQTTLSTYAGFRAIPDPFICPKTVLFRGTLLLSYVDKKAKFVDWQPCSKVPVIFFNIFECEFKIILLWCRKAVSLDVFDVEVITSAQRTDGN